MITSHTNQTVKDLMKLKQKKYQDKYYLVEGQHLVEEAVKAGVVELIISDHEIDFNEELLLVSSEIINKLSFTKSPQGILAKCKKKKGILIPDAKRTLILDNVQDPGNIGTLIRSALAFNADQVVLSKQSCDLYNDKVIRSSQGALFHLPIIIDDLQTVIKTLQSNDVIVVGSALENGTSIEEIKREEKMAFIVGNEGNGMDKEVLSLCDKIAYIDINNIDSLNVSIAGSIILYNFR